MNNAGIDLLTSKREEIGYFIFCYSVAKCHKWTLAAGFGRIDRRVAKGTIPLECLKEITEENVSGDGNLLESEDLGISMGWRLQMFSLV